MSGGRKVGDPVQHCQVRGGVDVNEILRDATPGKVSSSRQFSKSGGLNQANQDFDALVGQSAVQVRPGGLRTATLPNGTQVNVRPQSSSGKPTLEIQPPTGKTIKVRYD